MWGHNMGSGACLCGTAWQSRPDGRYVEVVAEEAVGPKLHVNDRGA